MSLNGKQKIFFPNLDGLRFICFGMVFFFHSYKTIFENLRESRQGVNKVGYQIVEFLFKNGELGVNFFFVLSGFLITYLLIKEKEFTGNIHLKNFYIRRILRIWPLFYLCVFIGFIIWPIAKHLTGGVINESSNPWYYLFLINNFDFIRQQSIGPNIFPDALVLIVLWSVAVEEQFYLSWPILLKSISKKTYPFLFLGILAGTIVFRSFYSGLEDSNHIDQAFRNFHTLSVIGDMAVGALFAYYCSFDNPFFKWVKGLKRGTIILIYSSAIFMVLFREEIFYRPILITLERLFYSVIFGLIILEQNYSRSSIFKFSGYKRLSKLGIYTYGLYCLHFLAISIVNNAFPRIGLKINNIGIAWVLCILALIISILLARFIYNYFEVYFLRFKDRFAYITKA